MLINIVSQILDSLNKISKTNNRSTGVGHSVLTNTSGAVGGNPLPDAEPVLTTHIGAYGGLHCCARRPVTPAITGDAHHRLRGEFCRFEGAEAAVVRHVAESIGAVDRYNRITRLKMF